MIVDLVSTRSIVLDSHSEARGSGATIQSELLLLRGCASVLDAVVPLLVDKGWETSLALLARVEAIPAVVHISVKLVVEAALLVLNVDWLHSAIHAISVQVVEDHDANISNLA